MADHNHGHHTTKEEFTEKNIILLAEFRTEQYRPKQRDRGLWRRNLLSPLSGGNKVYPKKTFGSQNRRFTNSYLSEFNWLEYSIKKMTCFVFHVVFLQLLVK